MLPQDWVKPPALRYLAGTEFEELDRRYLSGTEWEYFEALQAAEVQGRNPTVLVHRRTESRIGISNVLFAWALLHESNSNSIDFLNPAFSSPDRNQADQVPASD